MDDQRTPAFAQGERLEHPGQPEVVIGVVVREEHLGQLHKPDGGAEQLALGASPQSKSRRSLPRRRRVPAGLLGCRN